MGERCYFSGALSPSVSLLHPKLYASTRGDQDSRQLSFACSMFSRLWGRARDDIILRLALTSWGRNLISLGSHEEAAK